MKDTGARLCLLITDCCAHGSKSPLNPNIRLKQLPQSTFYNTSVCRSLFFRHTGFVDVTSAGPGELAWSVGPTDANNAFIGKEPTDGEVFENGGLFTTSLLDILAMHDGELKENNMMDRQGRITWDSIKSHLEKTTEKRFQENIYSGFRKQREKDKHKHQTVTFISTGQPVGSALPTTSRSRFGIEIAGGQNGVVAGNVDPDRTPAWAGMMPGDRLVSVRRFTDSYYAHFWQDRKFTNGSQLGNDPVAITEFTSFQKLSTPGKDFEAPFLSSGMWVFTLDRNGVATDISVRITEPSAFRR